MENIFAPIQDIDGCIANYSKEISGYLSMNKDTVKMFGAILAYCHNVENDNDNILWAEEMIKNLTDKLKERSDTYNAILESLKK